ncbi:hypothetical protein CYMTET_42646 [Cymbomonas tetramitiformis]|uniref:Uncharacterized protein n=1 Tax=Cymbomonas tetramitiformis TaxID=36881 RepID=A0AAE0C3V6_9CHLO|nr:hypothetical protein CYMTET_42646 [Cymbomonas tetramitiformis]
MFGLDAEFATLLAVPASMAVGLAYWLADKQDDIQAGDMIASKPSSEATDADEEIDFGDSTYDIGEPIKLTVGKVGAEVSRRFFVQKTLPDASEIHVVTLERPAGIVFAQDEGSSSIVVGGLIEGGNAFQLNRVAQLTQQMGTAPKEGDVLRGATSVEVDYGAGALVGSSLPDRVIVYYEMDKLDWETAMNCLRRGKTTDGPVQFVIERVQQ